MFNRVRDEPRRRYEEYNDNPVPYNRRTEERESTARYADLYSGDIEKIVVGRNQHTLPLFPLEVSVNSMWNRYAIFDDGELKFHLDRDSLPTAECLVCRSIEDKLFIRQHIVEQHPLVHPSVHCVHILFKRQYFTPAPYMVCRICKQRLDLPAGDPTSNEKISNSWGKEHLVIYHKEHIQKLVNVRFDVRYIQELNSETWLHNSLPQDEFMETEYKASLAEYTANILDIRDSVASCSRCNATFPLSGSVLSAHILTSHLPSTLQCRVLFPAPSYRCCLCGVHAGIHGGLKAKHAHLIQQHPLELQTITGLTTEEEHVGRQDNQSSARDYQQSPPNYLQAGPYYNQLQPSTPSVGEPSQRQNAGPSHQNARSGHQNSGSYHQNSGSYHHNAGSYNQNARSGHQNTGSGHQNTGSSDQNAGSSSQKARPAHQNFGSSRKKKFDQGITGLVKTGDYDEWKLKIFSEVDGKHHTCLVCKETLLSRPQTLRRDHIHRDHRDLFPDRLRGKVYFTKDHTCKFCGNLAPDHDWNLKMYHVVTQHPDKLLNKDNGFIPYHSGAKGVRPRHAAALCKVCRKHPDVHKTADGGYECCKCKKRSEHWNGWFDHLKEHKFTCKLCNKDFCDHGTGNVRKCCECQKEFTDSEFVVWENHVRAVHGGMVFVCRMCFKTLDEHKLGDKVKCCMCGKFMASTRGGEYEAHLKLAHRVKATSRKKLKKKNNPLRLKMTSAIGEYMKRKADAKDGETQNKK